MARPVPLSAVQLAMLVVIAVAVGLVAGGVGGPVGDGPMPANEPATESSDALAVEAFDDGAFRADLRKASRLQPHVALADAVGGDIERTVLPERNERSRSNR